MKAVGIRELKNQLSRYVDLVRAGETVLVTDRGHVVAELRPPGQGPERSDLPPALLDAIRQGRATMPAPRDPSVYERISERITWSVPEGTTLEILDELRGER